jgi:hypothetical protein
MVTINQCLDMVERVRRGETDAGAYLDSLRRTHTAPVVDLAQIRRGRQRASQLLALLCVDAIGSSPKVERAKALNGKIMEGGL